MSRVGKNPILIPAEVIVKLADGVLTVQGPKGELKEKMNPWVDVKLNDKELLFTIKDPQNKKERALWGTCRSIAANMILGVCRGFFKQLEINGVGYKAELRGDTLVLHIGYSHPIHYQIPEGINIVIDKNLMTISGIDKQLVGETAAQIRKIKQPEPYKGKGIKYIDEVIRRKAGKALKGASEGGGA